MFGGLDMSRQYGASSSSPRVTINPIPEVIPDKSNDFTQEQWQDWFDWDGVVDSLSPPTPCYRSLEINKSDQTSSPRRRIRRVIGQNPTNLFIPNENPPISNENPPISKKRKQSTPDSEPSKDQDVQQNRQSGTQRSHTIIEKRYRTNLNHKIAELRESVPSLRMNQLDSTDLGPLTPADKMHKGTILSKAAEYIQQLEKRNESLVEEITQLRQRKRTPVPDKEGKDGLQQVGLHVQDGGELSQESGSGPREDSYSTYPQYAYEGMIRVPENMKRLRSAAPQEHYAGQLKSTSGQSDYLAHEPNSLGQQETNRGKIMGRLMIGSLAGLFIMGGISEKENDGHDSHDRGLWALTHPVYFIATYSRRFFQMLFSPSQVLGVPSLLKVAGIFFILLLALFIYLFNAKPTSSRKPAVITLAAAPSPASPIEVRQKAWLTSIQTVWVPRHKMLPELIALHLAVSKYVLMQMIGWSGYAWLTGKTDNDEIARIKAWDIAIDAQLTGGDSEVSKSRLLMITAALDRVEIDVGSKRRLSDASNDTGYESLSDPDNLV